MAKRQFSHPVLSPVGRIALIVLTLFAGATAFAGNVVFNKLVLVDAGAVPFVVINELLVMSAVPGIGVGFDVPGNGSAAGRSLTE